MLVKYFTVAVRWYFISVCTFTGVKHWCFLNNILAHLSNHFCLLVLPLLIQTSTVESITLVVMLHRIIIVTWLGCVYSLQYGIYITTCLTELRWVFLNKLFYLYVLFYICSFESTLLSTHTWFIKTGVFTIFHTYYLIWSVFSAMVPKKDQRFGQIC